MAGDDVAWYQRLLEVRPELIDEVPCWTVIQPLTKPVTVAEVVRRLGGDQAEIEYRSGWDADAATSVVHLNQLGPAVVMAEVMDAEGIREEVLRWLSDGAVVHSSWWGSANGRSFLCYAVFGRLLTQLQHLDDDRPGGEQPEALDEDRAALRRLTDDPDLDYPAQLALMERRTGIRLDAAWLDQPHPTVVLRKPIPDDPRPPGSFAATDPDLAAMLLMAGDPTYRAALRWVLDLLADDWELRSEPLVNAVLGTLTRDWPASKDLGQEAHAMDSRLSAEVNASPGMSPERWRRFHRMRAGQAFTATVVNPNDRPKPLDTLWYAQQALQERWPAIRAELWRRARHQRGTLDFQTSAVDGPAGS
ncbi:DUF6461 domain-containing protein [Micromonospora avicenniae]|uniref:Uncharacterized protein n=1 Tax=Micromonospora avicenniae TaxID=1198245 RepID=A0A1N7C9V0_9ACTN|nr:DUF6461 domain-containing protein [Micromonospora avicenniae]SIR60214.1 hypothetical protein SAMN05444858_112206 [Micromonospora avicenniae]